MKVADVMTPRTSLVTATIPGTRGDVLERLQDNEFSSVPVVKETDEGEVFRGLVSRERLIEMPDEDQLALLVVEVESVSPDDDLRTLAAFMRETGQRRVPVARDGELTGIVTITDVVRAMANGGVEGQVDDGGSRIERADADCDGGERTDGPRSSSDERSESDGARTEQTDADDQSEVEALADPAVNCVHEATPLPVAEREIAYAQEAYAVVLDGEGEPTGMLTEVDVLDVAEVVEGEESTGDAIADEDDDWKWEGIKAIGSRYLPTRNVEIPSAPVREFMTEGLVTVSKTKTARDAAQLMIAEDVEQIPLMDGGELVGILRDTDLLKAL